MAEVEELNLRTMAAALELIFEPEQEKEETDESD